MLPEQDAFLERLFHTYFNELEVYAYALLKDRSDAEMAVQDAFHAACVKIDDVMASPNPVGWMKNAVKNISRNLRKRKSRESLLVLHFADSFSEPGSEDHHGFELHDQCKAILTQKEYELFVSVLIDGVPPIQKAQELGISIWACYKRIDRMLDKLRRALKDET